MSPESVANTHHISKESDIYSLGVLFLQVATQNPPMPNDNSTEVSEVQRWKEQLNQITKHPLLPLILRCFKFPVARPHIDHICAKIATTKDSPQNVVSSTLHHTEVNIIISPTLHHI